MYVGKSGVVPYEGQHLSNIESIKKKKKTINVPTKNEKRVNTKQHILNTDGTTKTSRPIQRRAFFRENRLES